jgi:hypothetical protein
LIQWFNNVIENHVLNWPWWQTPVIPVHGSQRQEAPKFKASLSYIVRPWFKHKKKTKNKQTEKEPCSFPCSVIFIVSFMLRLVTGWLQKFQISHNPGEKKEFSLSL